MQDRASIRAVRAKISPDAVTAMKLETDLLRFHTASVGSVNSPIWKAAVQREIQIGGW